MKKTFIFFILIILLISSCNVQSVNTERLIVGSWTDIFGEKLVFNSNGTYTSKGTNPFNALGNGRFTGTQLASDEGLVMNISVSSDGKTMILSWTDSSLDGFYLYKE